MLPEPENYGGRLRVHWYLALLVALIVAGGYLGLIVTLDNTNVGTTNGLWKTPGVRRASTLLVTAHP